MKKSVIPIAIFVISILASCQKNETTNDTFNVDLKKYDTQLNEDYLQANDFHKSISGPGNVDTAYFKMMFNKNDSLFCEHFYQFCIDMMKNSGMMNSSNGMMGNNSGMMGSGGMMNGGNMGSMQDMTKMMSYMDSLHNATRSMMKPDFYKNDSLMHNQMTMCKMMTTQTASIEKTYTEMQSLRVTHKLMH
jgi:hypothetical protein